LFPRALVDKVVAPIRLRSPAELRGAVGLLGGLDWGVTTDRSALCAIGRLRHPGDAFVVACAGAWRPGHPLIDVVREVAGLDVACGHLTAESNGVGAMPAQEVRRLVGDRLEVVHTTGELKLAAYSALRTAMERQQLVIPEDAVELRRELLALRVVMLPTSERIEAATGHDDLSDALALATGPFMRGGEWRTLLGEALDTPAEFPDRMPPRDELVPTGGGRLVPRDPRLANVGAQRNRVTVESYMESPETVILDDSGFSLRPDQCDRDEHGNLLLSPWRREVRLPPALAAARRRERLEDRADRAREAREQLADGGSSGRMPSAADQATTAAAARALFKALDRPTNEGGGR
jgi:hypothetical protein